MRTRSCRMLALVVALCLTTAFTMVGCGQEAADDPQQPEETIVLGSSTFSEPWILSEMAVILIEEKTDLQAEHTSGFTAEGLMHEALLEDELNGYISWTGTIFTALFDMDVTEEWRDRDRVLEFVTEEYQDQYEATVMPPFGFNNTYIPAVRQKFADEHGLQTISDLRDHSEDLILACDYDFTEREGDGLDDFLQHYNLEFDQTEPMDYGMVYRAVGEGDVDVSVAYSTDGRIEAQDLVVLEDDQDFFPPYDGILIMDTQVLQDYPEVEEALEVLWGAIDEETMAKLNAEVDVHERDYQDVAREFLQEQGWID